MVTRLAPFYGKYIKTAVFAPIFVILETICELMLPLIGADIINTGIGGGDVSLIVRLGLRMLLVAALSLTFGVLSARAGTYSNQGYAGNLRRALFEKIQDFSFSDIDRFSSGSLITRITNDVNVIVIMLAMVIRMMPRSLIQLVGAVIIAVQLNARLSMVLVVMLPVLLVTIVVMMKISFPLFRNMQKRVDGLNNTVQENLTGMRVVKAFVRRDFENEKFAVTNDALMSASLAAMNKVILMQPIMMLCMYGAIAAVLWFGGNMLLDGSLAAGDLSAVLMYINQILMSIMMLVFALLNYSRAKVCSDRIIEVLDSKPAIVDGADAQTFSAPETKGHVRFSGVSFQYGDGTQVLEQVDLDIAGGEFVALVGGTGAGKSSLVNLIPRFYDVTGGKVLVDGLDVRSYPLDVLRNKIGMVLQKNVLFSGTLRENLKWGKVDATDEELIAATKSADIYDFIAALPEGFDTWVEQGGVNFSGGQKQRLCIARAMIKRPAILILDDSTSAVDTATEARIRSAFKRDLPGTTVLIIAQRISSVQYADKIVVLDEGRIAAVGTHDALMETSKIYQEIYQSQQEGVQEV